MSEELVQAGGSVVIGDNPPVSMQLVQSIYNDITGKTEKIHKNLKEKHNISFEDVEQLDLKIQQLFEQYNIVSRNCHVTVFYKSDTKERFSTFERFKMFNSSSSSACENLSLEYDFYVVLPQSKKGQAYKVTVNLHSTVAFSLKTDDDGGPLFQIYRLMGMSSGSVSIEYVDYTVANTFLNTIMDWYKTVDKSTTSKTLKRIQKYTYYFSDVFSALFIIATTVGMVSSANLLIQSDVNIASLFGYIVPAFAALHLASLLGGRIGSYVEMKLDSLQSASTLNFTKGDKQALSLWQKEQRQNKWSLSVSLASYVFLGLASTFMEKIIEYLI